jgi:chemotaxis family two-component system response regulator PixH
MKKILVVDDDPSLLALVRAFLKEDYETVPFLNGKEALEAATKIRPDLILTDVLMTGMSGYDFFLHLKKGDSPLKNIPVIVMSTRENLKHVFDEKTMLSFLPKPFTKNELRQAVSLVLGKTVDDRKQA